MTEQQLPQLPEPTTRYFCNKCGQFGDTQEHHRPYGPKCDYMAVGYKSNYTADQMRAYAIAAVAAERERCAQKCERRADSLREGSAVARQCAADIRNGLTIKEPSNV